MNIKLALITFVGLLLATGCNSQNKQEANSQDNKRAMGKSIVIFFSHAGENYSVGNVKEGNTKIVADYISELTGADLYEIVTHKYDGMAYKPSSTSPKKRLTTASCLPMKVRLRTSRLTTQSL